MQDELILKQIRTVLNTHDIPRTAAFGSIYEQRKKKAEQLWKRLFESRWHTIDDTMVKIETIMPSINRQTALAVLGDTICNAPYTLNYNALPSFNTHTFDLYKEMNQPTVIEDSDVAMAIENAFAPMLSNIDKDGMSFFKIEYDNACKFVAAREAETKEYCMGFYMLEDYFVDKRTAMLVIAKREQYISMSARIKKQITMEEYLTAAESYKELLLKKITERKA